MYGRKNILSENGLGMLKLDKNIIKEKRRPRETTIYNTMPDVDHVD